MKTQKAFPKREIALIVLPLYADPESRYNEQDNTIGGEELTAYLAPLSKLEARLDQHALSFICRGGEC